MSRRAPKKSLPQKSLPLEQEDASPPDRGRAATLVGWLVVLLVAAAFAPVVPNGIAPVDDSQTVCFNPRFNPPQFTADGVGWYWAHADQSLYVPLTQTAWAILARATYVATPDEQQLHVDPRVFHAASVAVHAINAGLVFAVLWVLLRRHAGTRSAWPAAAGALLYGLHPMQVEAVAWLSGLKDLLYTTASLASVLLYLRAVDPAPNATAGRRRTTYVAGLLLVPVGMLCKPTAMVAPLIAASLDLLILRRPFRRVALAVAPYVLAAVPLAVVAKLAQPAAAVTPTPAWTRPVVAGASLGFYATKLVAPIGLTYDYGWRPVLMLRKPWFWAAGLAALAVVAWVIGRGGAGRPRASWPAAAVAVAVAALLPVLGWVPFDFQHFSIVADHYTVLAMLGPALLLAWGLAAVARSDRPAARAAATVACVAWLLGLGAAAVRQGQFWHTPERLAERMVATTPWSGLAHTVIGEVDLRHGDAGAAERELRLAMALNDEFMTPPRDLAKIYAAQGRPGEAIEAFRAYVRVGQRFPPELRPSLDGFIPTYLLPIAARLNRRDDYQQYLREQVRLFGPPAVTPR